MEYYYVSLSKSQAAFGRVLVGFDVPDNSKNNFERSLNGSKFKFIEETNNIAIRIASKWLASSTFVFRHT